VGTSAGQTFIKNARLITGGIAVSTGLFFSVAGIYQFHSHKNIIAPSQTDRHKSGLIHEYLATRLDHMSVNQKLSAGASLILLGSLLFGSPRASLTNE
jgi:hypothetical protein